MLQNGSGPTSLRAAHDFVLLYNDVAAVASFEAQKRMLALGNGLLGRQLAGGVPFDSGEAELIQPSDNLIVNAVVQRYRSTETTGWSRRLGGTHS